MTTLSHSLVELVLQQAQGQGVLPSRMPGVVLMRADRHLRRASTVYEPCIVVVAQGRKAVYFHGQRNVYDGQRCLSVNLPLPLESETFGSSEKPFLGLAVAVRPGMVSELLMQMKTAPPEPATDDVLSSVALDNELLSAAVRLAEALCDDDKARVLGPQIVRELIYLLLRSPGGRSLRSMAVGDSRLARIAKVIRRLHTEFADHQDMLTLAREAGMGLSSFHASFKAVTGETPLQYLKLIRLHHARNMMVNSGLSAQASAAQVGYESASHFSREFKRVFGGSPGAVAAKIRVQLKEGGESQLRAMLSFSESGF